MHRPQALFGQRMLLLGLDGARALLARLCQPFGLPLELGLGRLVVVRAVHEDIAQR